MPSVFPAIGAGSIGELAEKLELDPGKLEATVHTYNAAVQPSRFDASKLDGNHTKGLTPPKTNWAQKIDSPPYLCRDSLGRAGVFRWHRLPIRDPGARHGRG